MAQPATLRVRVVQVIRETPDAHSLVLEPVDAPEGIDYRPGQFVTVRVPSSRDGGAARCYSLCSSPHRAEKPRITVKRTAGGYGSNWICDNVVEGATLEMLRPSGTFTPGSLDEDVLLLAGGSGITPVMSILKSCLSAGTGSVTLIYANCDEQSVIFRDELMTLAEEYPERLTIVHWLESVQGLPTEPGIRALVAPYTDRRIFLCGPGPFMELATAVLTTLQVPAERINVERFSSLRGDPFADDEVEIDTSGPSSTVEVELDGQTRTVSWPRGNKLLDALLEAGVDAPFSCREGACSACACVLLDGEVTLDNNEVLDQQDLDDGLILACQARPVTGRLKVTYDE
ncbi:ferredoxin--NADP reductase [Haloactinomyces albus]|uniref:3-ketosteroid-9-alpha-monooxygenase, ferredoxin reductase component n=1 Tax=Haloactinomyces albus TaxID=1352928 RepID=A0AAE3ZHR1_9ACTN|nr:ferredoxin--NADP reductase [Haloactinomyces albus]MDR7303890.1 3-ketosteroid 9alpha-monooxygenase subunit B [Haloactinomyces albus]